MAVKLVQRLPAAKGGRIVSTPPNGPASCAIRLIAEKGTGSPIELNRDAHARIVTEREIGREVILYGRSLNKTPLADTVALNSLTSAPDPSVDQNMGMTNGKYFRDLPDVSNARDFGMISIGEPVQGIIADLKANDRATEDRLPADL